LLCKNSKVAELEPPLFCQYTPAKSPSTPYKQAFLRKLTQKKRKKSKKVCTIQTKAVTLHRFSKKHHTFWQRFLRECMFGM